MSLSFIVPLNIFTQFRTNRMLPGTYPREGFMRSRLGENGRAPATPVPARKSKGRPVTAHLPVHAAFKSGVRIVNGIPFFFACACRTP